LIRAENDKDIYLVFEYMETDLHAVIRANNILEEIHKQYVIYQILKCLKYMHSAELLHRDLKPSNILLNSECLAKVCDLGLARSIAVKEEGTVPVLTEYVATRWYRAPEILLGSQKYTKGVDMWSLGCILGELLLGKPIFPGTSTLNQLDRILELTGRPSAEDIEAIQSSLAGTMLEALPQTKTKALHEFFPTASDEALDLLKNLLKFNPNKRFTAEQALEHPFVAEFHNLDDEPSCDRVIEIAIDDNTKFSIREYRDKLYQEIMKKKKEQRKVILENTFIPNNVPVVNKAPARKEEEKMQKHSNYQQNEQKYEKINYGNSNVNLNAGKKPMNSNNNNSITSNISMNPYNKQTSASVKGKNNTFMGNGGVAASNVSANMAQIQKNIIAGNSMNEKNYNFINSNMNSNSQGLNPLMNKMNAQQSVNRQGFNNKEEKNEKFYEKNEKNYQVNPAGAKNILNSGIVYRTNNTNPILNNNKKPNGKN